MGRALRPHIEGQLYHAMFRGNGGANIFDNPAACYKLLALLWELAPAYRCAVFAWCLMGNHAHLLLQVAERALGDFMGVMLSAYSRYVNFMRGTRGHLLQDRYLPIPVSNDAQLLCTLRYIHRNPVEAGFCATVDDWEFSSHRAFLGAWDGIVQTRPLMSFFTGPDPKAAYARFMRADAPARLDYLEKARWVEIVNPVPSSPEPPKPRISRQLTDLAAAVAREGGSTVEEMRADHRSFKSRLLRRKLVHLALSAGFHQSEVARVLGCSRSAVSQLAADLGQLNTSA